MPGTAIEIVKNDEVDADSEGGGVYDRLKRSCRSPLFLKRNIALDIAAKKRKELFLETWPSISQNILNSNKFADVPDVPKWLKKVYDYNLQGGKKNRGLTTVLAYEMLESPDKVTDEMLKLARVLGWCVELMQAFFVMLDDLMDSSEMRRGSPCWYRVPGVGLNVINDALLIQGVIYQVILKTYFEDKPYYKKIVDLFNEVTKNFEAPKHPRSV
ncbi:Farnesyl pyrophosphate synthase 1, mitochondrial [Eumeta japonica]|uniref:Farnesyl pyrophosphate synthase n=1 Tax=Eumeta variegata TaxID=151549 RepID=A0A4C1XMN3_EUMVA|nr:Farnesyl pyrophosphate synthase 1, mitochondrial [Eumeta japonica]